MTDMTHAAPAVGDKRASLARLSDTFAAALAASLPWSTSATGILVAIWVLTLLPTIEWSALRRDLARPPCAIPLLLVGLAILGMLWADVDLVARAEGLASFLKLLAIPLLLYQFSRSERGTWVLGAFLASSALLLTASWLNVLMPSLPWTPKMPGIPVKDYISQSGIFTLCIFGLLYLAADMWPERRAYSLALGAAGLLFLANIVYVATGRTALAVIPILFVLFGVRRFPLRRLAIFLLVGLLAAATAWATSSYLRERVTNVGNEIEKYRFENADTSSGERLEFWRSAAEIVEGAPWFGNGTGSVRDSFRRVGQGRSQIAANASNPHNQIFAVAIQLGALGAVLLLAMWVAHWRLFWTAGLPGWLGLVVVTQNVISSLFNSHLFDFTQGWVYVVGVGVLGGMVVRKDPGFAVERSVPDAPADR